ncbi:hypothetical protein HK100_010052, partial [Physocladia obscura]
ILHDKCKTITELKDVIINLVKATSNLHNEVINLYKDMFPLQDAIIRLKMDINNQQQDQEGALKTQEITLKEQKIKIYDQKIETLRVLIESKYAARNIVEDSYLQATGSLKSKEKSSPFYGWIFDVSFIFMPYYDKNLHHFISLKKNTTNFIKELLVSVIDKSLATLQCVECAHMKICPSTIVLSKDDGSDARLINFDFCQPVGISNQMNTKFLHFVPELTVHANSDV